MTRAKRPVPEGFHTVTPQLTLENTAQAIDWYTKALGGSPMSLWVYVDDCDTLFNRALSAGATIAGPMGHLADQFWGDRSGTLTDPFGYRWSIATHKEDMTREEMEERGAEFFKSQAPQHAGAH